MLPRWGSTSWGGTLIAPGAFVVALSQEDPLRESTKAMGVPSFIHSSTWATVTFETSVEPEVAGTSESCCLQAVAPTMTAAMARHTSATAKRLGPAFTEASLFDGVLRLAPLRMSWRVERVAATG